MRKKRSQLEKWKQGLLKGRNCYAFMMMKGVSEVVAPHLLDEETVDWLLGELTKIKREQQ